MNGGSKPEFLVPLHVARLQDRNRYVRRSAAFKLGQLGEKARLAVPALKSSLSDSDDRVRMEAERALTKIGSITNGLESHSGGVDSLR